MDSPEHNTDSSDSIKTRAEAAANAAQTAKDNAESSAATANIAKGNAETSASAVEAAKVRAEASATAADTAKVNAEASANSANTAKLNAEVSATAADTAKVNAETSANSANTAKLNAEASATAADTAKTNAESSAAASNAAKNNSEASVAAANSAKGNAETSASAANNSKVNAEASATAADTAKVNAEASANSANTAKLNAEVSATAADTAKTNAEVSATAANEELKKASDASERAIIEANKAAEAHHLSTAVGLAGAFNVKAMAATRGQHIWSGVLCVALLFIVGMGAYRFNTIADKVQNLADKGDIISALGIELLLSTLSVAAPVWLAWMSSKMISRYFHLSEDYAYKAAIATAYMGFKDQAKNRDPIFEERLFAAAITQLDSNPLRFFNSESHPSSPLQDLLQQPFMQSALNNPTFKTEFIGWINRVFKTNFYVPNIDFSSKSQASPEAKEKI